MTSRKVFDEKSTPSSAAAYVSLACCFLCGLSAGTLYLYSAYAPQLASRLSIPVTTTSSLGMIGNIGLAATGPLSGMLVDKKGPQISILIGIVFLFTGYNIIRVLYEGELAAVPVLAFAMFLVGSGSTFTFSAIVKCAVVNFPERRGVATSVTLAAIGLSAAFFSAIQSIFHIDSTAKFLSLMTFLPTSILVLSIYFVRYRTPQLVDLKQDRKLDLHDEEKGYSIGSGVANIENIDIHGSRLWQSKSFLRYLVVLGIISGVCQMYIYSCGYIVKALASNENAITLHHLQSNQVGLISFASFGGRLGSGVITDWLVSHGHKRRLVLMLAAVGCCFAQVLGLMLESISHLWLISLLVGFSYGICYGTLPTIISEEFGLLHFSQNWGQLAIAPVPISYVFNMMFGYYYDMNSVDVDNTHVCFKLSLCYSSSFHITIIASALVVLILLKR